jgi:hypothetical protein
VNVWSFPKLLNNYHTFYLTHNYLNRKVVAVVAVVASRTISHTYERDNLRQPKGGLAPEVVAINAG